MGYYMGELYRRYFRALDFSELKEAIEHTSQEARAWLDQTPPRAVPPPADPQDPPTTNPTQSRLQDRHPRGMGPLP